MFFEFSKEKVNEILSVSGIIMACILSTLYMNNKFHFDSQTQIYWERNKVATQYYWQYKFPGLTQSLQEMASAMSAFIPNLLSNSSSVSAEKSFTGNGAPARSIPVLAYHGIPSETKGGGLITLPGFVEQMKALKEAGWQTITMQEFYSYIKQGEPMPDKSFLLTFDDGRKDTYYPVDPVLKDLGYTAVMFVITDFSMPQHPTKDSTYYLSETELKSMQDSGRWELESHGAADHGWYAIDSNDTEAHFLSNKLWLSDFNRLETDDEFKTRILNDLSDSKIKLEKTFNTNVIAYAYPFSDYGQDTLNYKNSKTVISQAVPIIYKLSFYQTYNGAGDSFNYPGADSTMMKRIEPPPDWDGPKLLSVMEGGRAKELPYTATNFGEEWLGTWGNVVRSDNLDLSATRDTSGAAVFLNGSHQFKDYKFTTDVDWQSGSNVFLMARYTDNNNYLACVYSHNDVVIQERKDGISTNLAKLDYSLPYGVAKLPLSVTVNGNNISCGISGQQILSSTVYDPSSRFAVGGVGMQVWDVTKGKADAVFLDASVVAIQ